MSLRMPRSPFRWCPDCEGKGVRTAPDGTHTSCPTCGGQGRLRIGDLPAQAMAPADSMPPPEADAGLSPPAPADPAVRPPAAPRRAGTPATAGRTAPAGSGADDDAYGLGFARHAASRAPADGGGALVDADGVLRLACAGGPPRGSAKPAGRRKDAALFRDHAAERLIATAARQGLATAGTTLFLTQAPCPACARLIIGAGIRRVVVDPAAPAAPPGAERDAVRRLLADAQVELAD